MPNKQTEYSLQYLVNLLADMDVSPPVIRFGLVAKAADGPLEGSYVNVGAKYNTETGNYELLTAGSGTSTTTDTTNTFLLESGYDFLLETGDELLLEA